MTLGEIARHAGYRITGVEDRDVTMASRDYWQLHSGDGDLLFERDPLLYLQMWSAEQPLQDFEVPDVSAIKTQLNPQNRWRRSEEDLAHALRGRASDILEIAQQRTWKDEHARARALMFAADHHQELGLDAQAREWVAVWEEAAKSWIPSETRELFPAIMLTAARTSNDPTILTRSLSVIPLAESAIWASLFNDFPEYAQTLCAGHDRTWKLDLLHRARFYVHDSRTLRIITRGIVHALGDEDLLSSLDVLVPWIGELDPRSGFPESLNQDDPRLNAIRHRDALAHAMVERIRELVILW
jgi:hypothetical protein